MNPEPILRGVSLNDLGRLTLRGHVAYAARAARRMLALFQLPDNFPEREASFDAVRAAVLIAEAFARGAVSQTEEVRPVTRAAYQVAEATHEVTGFAGYAMAHAARSACEASLAAGEPESNHVLEALASAFGASHVLESNCGLMATEVVVRALRADFERLVALGLGEACTLGEPIDASETGPLGGLWPAGTPDWYGG